MAEPLLELDGITLRYGAVTALDDVSLSIPRGGAMGLVGESGSGKSSLVLAILGLQGRATLTARQARFDGANLLHAAPTLRGKRLGMVFQDPGAALNPALTIGWQVAEPLMQHQGMPPRQALARAEELLAEMQIPRAAQVARAYPHQLSGGMKQRAVIATALACAPDLLLLDEPTTALDVTVEAQILDLLDNLRRQRGLSLLLVSHNLGIVDRLCDDTTVLYAGRVVEQGRTRSLLAAPRHPYARGLLGALPAAGRAMLTPIPGKLPDLAQTMPGCNFQPRCPFAGPGCEAPQPLLDGLRCHRGAAVQALPWPDPPAPPPQPPPGAVLVQASGLRRGFRQRGMFGPVRETLAVDDVSLEIRQGEVLGLVGESGCGKSTLGRLLLRLLPTEAGSLRFAGTDLPAEPDASFRRRAQIVFQNPDSSLNPRLTVAQALRRPLDLFGIPNPEAEIDRLLTLVRLPLAYRQRFPHQLSGGEKQRIGIARALASRPDFLVCDEAVSALDVSVQAAVLNLFAELRAELNLTLLFISHDIGVVAHMADRVAVMYRGAIVEQGPAGQVLAAPRHPYTQALLSAVPVLGQPPARLRLAGDITTPAPPGGCRFAHRCPLHAGPVCDTAAPLMQEGVACHRAMTGHVALTNLSQ